MDGQIAMGHVTLSEPHELTLNTTFLAGCGLRGLHLEVEAVVHLLGIFYAVFG